jgi:hypothetical protein
VAAAELKDNEKQEALKRTSAMFNNQERVIPAITV